MNNDHIDDTLDSVKVAECLRKWHAKRAKDAIQLLTAVAAVHGPLRVSYQAFYAAMDLKIDVQFDEDNMQVVISELIDS